MARGVRNPPKGGNGPQDKRPQSAHTKAANFHAKVANWMSKTSEAPVFHPTQEEWENPMAFIRSIRPRAERYGICKIVPPTTSTVPASRVIRGPDDEPLQFHVRHQPLSAQPTANLDYMRFETSAEPFDMRRYCDLAYRKEMKLLGAYGGLAENSAEAEYWRRRGNSDKENSAVSYVEYGNDVEGTAFCDKDSDDPLGHSAWNMRVLPKVPGSSLQLLDTDVPGVSTPMLYIGMVSATFAWHVEDHYLYSINYQHQGAAKTWYGVAGCDADAFEEACERHVFHEALGRAVASGELQEADRASKIHSVLLEKTTMFSPEVLITAGVPVSRAVQRPGEFVVTFPRAYHAGFSHGFSIGEAVNFATGDWFLFGAECCERYRRVGRMPIVPHELLICRAAAELDEALARGALPESMGEDDARALAGVFVDLVRQQHAQRRVLVQQGAQQLWKEADQLTDCCRCKRLSYITVAIDNQVALGIQETMCLDCAVAHSHSGHSLKILCSRNIRALERRAKFLEQHSLLKGRTAEWLGMREGRGMGECKRYGRCPGVLPLPLPTEAFQWRRLPDISDPSSVSRPFAHIKFPVVPASGAPVPDSDLGLSTVASFGRGHPPLIPAKQRCGAISADLLESPPSRPSQSRWQPQAAQSMPAWLPAAQPNVVTSGWQEGSTAQENSAELVWEPVGPQWEPVVPQPGPSGRNSPQPGQPGLPASTAKLSESVANAAQQEEQQPPLPVFMEEDAPAPAPTAALRQRNPAPKPAAQQKRMKGATKSWSPLAFIPPAQPEEPVPEPETPPEAEAPRTKQQAVLKTITGAKRKHDGANDGEGQKRPKVALQHVAAPARAPAKPSSRARLAQEGKAPGQGGAMHYRAVFHLDGSPGIPMLDLKDVAKATGWKLRFNVKASVRDMARSMWKLARQEALARDAPPSAVCGAPQAHHCSGCPAGPDRFLLGLPHIRTLYSMSTQPERAMLEAFCGDLWSAQEMQEPHIKPVKQEVDPPKGSAGNATGRRLVLPSPTVSGQPVGTDFSFWQPSAEAASAMAQEADGVLGKAFFNVMAQHPGTLCIPQPSAMPQPPRPWHAGLAA